MENPLESLELLWRFSQNRAGAVGINGHCGTNLVLSRPPTFIPYGTKHVSGFIRYGTKLVSGFIRYGTNLVLLNISVNCANSLHDLIRKSHEFPSRFSSLIA